MINIKEFFKKLKKEKKRKKNNFCEKILKNFFESDVQGSEIILEEIFGIIKNVKKNGEKKEFIGNSFELVFSKKSVNFFNQFTEEFCEISLEKFEKSLKIFNKKKFN